MVVCKFFLQGNCRYGNKCWNDHPNGGNQGYAATAQRQLFGGGRGSSGGQKVSFHDSFSNNQNPYKWVSQDAKQQQQQQGQSFGQQQQQLSSADIVKGLGTEMKTWEASKMWPFSVVGFEKDSPCIPGFDDVSPEEMRLEAYDAEKNGNIQLYMQKIAGLINSLNDKRNELKNPSMTFKQKLISFIDDSRKQKPGSSGSHVSLFSGSSTGAANPSSSNQPGFGSQSSSVFGPSGSQPSVFGSSGSPSNFGQTQAGQGAFGQQSSQSYVFGKPQGEQNIAQPQNLFGQSTFGQPSSFGQQIGTQSGLFGQTNQSGLFGKPAASGFGTGVFGLNPQTQAPSSQSVFGASGPTVDQTLLNQAAPSCFGATSASSAQTSGSLFGSSSNTLNSNTSIVPPGSAAGGGGHVATVTSLHTPIDKLTAVELEQFQAATFTLGKIPTKPPPRELCF